MRGIRLFLAEIEISNDTLSDGVSVYTIWRLVGAKDKNDAWDKTSAYITKHYITHPETEFRITIHEAIV